MSKKLWEPLKQFLVLLAATGSAFFFAPTIHQLVPLLYQLFPLYKPSPPSTELEFARVIVPFMAPIFYMIFGVLGELIAMFSDKRRYFIGTYLSFPSDPEYINIFKIERYSGKYNLVGYRFSLSANKATGYWRSDQLEMKTTEPLSLLYIYVGEQHEPNKLSGRGFVEITFDGPKPHRGHGCWVSALPQVKPQYSSYVMLTKDIRRKIIKKAVFFNRHEYPYVFIRDCISEPETVFRAFAALTDNEKLQDSFKRATNTFTAAPAR